MGLLRLAGFAGILLSLAVPAARDAAAAESREKVRLILLDKCVADEWKVRKAHDKIVDECKCAAARVARDLGYDQVAAFVDKPPTAPRDYWLEATKACFRSGS